MWGYLSWKDMDSWNSHNHSNSETWEIPWGEGGRPGLHQGSASVVQWGLCGRWSAKPCNKEGEGRAARSQRQVILVPQQQSLPAIPTHQALPSTTSRAPWWEFYFLIYCCISHQAKPPFVNTQILKTICKILKNICISIWFNRKSKKD